MQKNQPVTKTLPSSLELLDNPDLNKGTAFTDEEREQLGLVGLLPDSVEDIDRQLERVLGHLQAKPTDLERYIYLIGLCDRNETLFYKLLMSDPMRFGGAFNEEVVRAMSKHNKRPIIFALSNPTDKAECSPEQAYTWSNGQALYAAGVQFPDVKLNGRTFRPG